MTAASPEAVLVLNSGSSSLKAGLFVPDRDANFAGERPVLVAQASGIGQGGGSLSIRNASGRELAAGGQSLQSQEEAFRAIADALKDQGQGPPGALGHRVVHGGPRLLDHTRLTPEVLDTLKQSIHFAPLHLPGSIQLIEQGEALYPGTPQVLCFDTTFHRTMPEVARRLPIPAEYAKEGVKRYGFHGLSYESIVKQLRARPAPLPDRIVVAHLGSGSSLCAIEKGASVDTTMGLTPAGGIPMATRTGDLDPGVLFFLSRQSRLSTEALEALVNHKSGLAAISGATGDMQQLEKAMHDPDLPPARRGEAALAFAIFATAIAKQIAALIVSLRGLDLLVFTGGIGEHSASLRAAVLDRLAPLGFRVDPEANARHAETIGSPKSKVAVEIVPAEEDLVIAAQTRTLVQK